MKKNTILFMLKLMFSLILSAGAPLVTALLLHVDEPTLGIFILIVVLNMLFLMRSAGEGGIKTFLNIVLGGLYILASLFIILYIVVIPYPSYLAWLELVRAGRPGGIISLLFFYGTSFFSSLFGGLVYKSGVARPLGGLLLVICFELAVVYQEGLSIFLFIAAVVLVFTFFALLPHKLKLKHAGAPLFLFAGVAAVSALLSLNSAPNSGYLVGRSLDMRLKRIILEIFPDLPLLTTVAGYGYDYRAEDLGGRPLLSNAPLFVVEGVPMQNIYLRTQVFDSYADNNWSLGFKLRKKIKSRQTHIIGSAITDKQPLKVSLLHDYFELLPHTLNTESLVVRTQNPVEITFGTLDSGFTLALPLLKQDSVIINSPLREFKPPVLNNELNDFLERIMPGGIINQPRSELADREEITEFYLQIPDSILESVRSLARDLRADSGEDWRTLRNIRDYLNKNYIYSLSTDYPPEGEDFIEDFLFTTKKGYCVHFASAFIILARLNGIPARYASGFFVYIPRGETEAVVSGLQAHVWPELWFPGIGWTILEVTPALDLATFYNSEYYRLFNPDGDALTERQLRALMGRKIAPPAEKVVDLSGLIIPAVYLLTSAAALAAVVLVFLGIVKALRKRKSIYGGNLKKIDLSLRRLVFKMEKREIPPPHNLGWMAWGKRMKQAFPQKKRHIGKLITLINEIFYHDHMPSKKNVRSLRVLIKQL